MVLEGNGWRMPVTPRLGSPPKLHSVVPPEGLVIVDEGPITVLGVRGKPVPNVDQAAVDVLQESDLFVNERLVRDVRPQRVSRALPGLTDLETASLPRGRHLAGRSS